MTDGPRQSWSLLAGTGLVLLCTIPAVLAPWLWPYDPVLDADLMVAEESPSLTYPFGTDDQGRDVFVRVVHGGRVSLLIGVVTQLVNTAIGLILGVSAGYFGGRWDDAVSFLTNLMLAIPSLIFALAIMAILGPGLGSLLIALALTNWAYTCRIARSQALSLRSREYVQAAKVLGYGDLRIMATQVLPNMLGPIVVIGTLGDGLGDPWRGGAVLPWARRTATAGQLGKHAVRRARQPVLRTLGLDISRHRHLRLRARTKSAGRRTARSFRPALGDPAVSALLEVSDLQISLDRGRQQVVAVDEVSFALSAGEVMGLVGESGCGKSLTALSLIGSAATAARRCRAVGSCFRVKALHEFNNKQWQQIRGTEIAMIFQEPMMALNPVMSVGAQIAEMFQLHRNASRREARTLCN